jgi:hypothetical protein
MLTYAWKPNMRKSFVAATTILLTTAKVKAREKKVAAKGDSMEAVSLGMFSYYIICKSG